MVKAYRNYRNKIQNLIQFAHTGYVHHRISIYTEEKAKVVVAAA